MEIIGDHWRLMEIDGDRWRSMEIDGDCGIVTPVTRTVIIILFANQVILTLKCLD